MNDLVRGGFAAVITRYQDTGHLLYTNGLREFLPTGAEAVSILQYVAGTWALGSEMTIAMMTRPNWANGDSTLRHLFSAYRTVANDFIGLRWQPANGGWRAMSVQGGVVAETALGSAHAAGDPVRFVLRHKTSDQLKLNFNGVNATSVADGKDAGTLAYLELGCQPTQESARNWNGYLGGVLVSPVSKTDAWTTAIQANSGSAYYNPLLLFGNFMDAGDALFPLGSDSRGFVKVSGQCPFRDEGQLVLDGSSLMVGLTTLGVQPRFRKFANLAVGGQRTTNMLTDEATQLYPMLDATCRRNVVVCMEGTNDLLYVDAAAGYANLAQYCSQARTNGFKAVICTVTHRSGQAAYNAIADTVNASIRANWATFSDGIADVYADVRLQDPDNATYYSDGIFHWTTAGNVVAAGIISDAVSLVVA
jgi:hypothetical protein